MILLNNSESAIVSNKTVKNVQSTEADNKNLWKHALEKNGLYIALNKFESISNHLKTEEALKTFNLQAAKKDINNTEEVSSGAENNISDILKKSLNTSLEGADIVSLKNTNNARLNMQYNALQADSVVNKSIGTSEDMLNVGTYQALAKSSRWLNKNAIVTVANSNLEVWIRDAALTGNKLSDILKNIKQSMAELGASLSKVSINGKVAFDRKK